MYCAASISSKYSSSVYAIHASNNFKANLDPDAKIVFYPHFIQINRTNKIESIFTFDERNEATDVATLREIKTNIHKKA